VSSAQALSAAKRTADKLQCELKTVCAALWCHSHQTSHGTNILYYAANILVWVGYMGRQQRDMDILLGEHATEWVGVSGQGTGR